MKHLKAFAIAVLLFIIFISFVLVIATKIVIPVKLDIGKSLEVPKVIDLELSEAKKLLRESGFVLNDSLSIEWIKTPKYPDRTVISQFPKAGKLVKNKSRIKLEVSNGGQLVVIPLILEENAINASSRLKQLGLEVELVKKNYGLYDQNSVVEVEPEIGSKVLKGSLVKLYIESEIEDIEVIADSLSESVTPDSLSMNNDSKEYTTIEEILEDM
jgi:serine/threonine-protein kinase